MTTFECPFCGIVSSNTETTHQVYYPSFSTPNTYGHKVSDNFASGTIQLNYHFCPVCNKTTLYISTASIQDITDIPPIVIPVYPLSAAKHFPNYVPDQIRSDYEEAFSILHLSPNASATLARRCLQGMIHEFWNIRERNLNAEISSLKNVVAPSVWKAIDGLRSLGNIGAHMEYDVNIIVDVSHNEAEKLLKLIEYLIKNWYIERHEADILLADITQIAGEKESLRDKDH